MRAARLISLLLLLQGRGRMTAAELAAALEVSERTVYRDVAALVEAGVPVWAGYGRDGGYRLIDGYRTRLTGLTPAEAEALFLSGVPAAATDLGLAGPLDAARRKVLAALPERMRDAADRSEQRFFLDAPRWFRSPEPPPALATLAGAVWADRLVLARYRDWPAARVLEPYALVLKSGVWYLVARSGGKFRTYRVYRFAEVVAEDGGFDREPFDLRDFWTRWVADFERSVLAERVTVRLSPAGVEALPHAVEWTAAQDALRAAGPPDGQGRVTVTLPVESLGIAHSVLLPLGAEVEVLEPAELRAMMARTAATLTEMYR
ncbi:MAG: helix-turn-helix transcriptional regulator [Mycobacteriales bacterium]